MKQRKKKTLELFHVNIFNFNFPLYISFNTIIFQIMKLFILLLIIFSAYETTAVVCPNQCSAHGVCLAENGGRCQCFPGYHGVDCSYKLCPSGTAWFDHPSADNVAHADYTECSNMVTTPFLRLAMSMSWILTLCTLDDSGQVQSSHRGVRVSCRTEWPSLR